jgi:(2Fe-2S) ferredoxin
MNEPVTRNVLAESVDNLGLRQIQRHLFLCCDQTKPKCCPKEEGLAVWDYLKKRLSELGLDRPNEEHPHCIFRTKANCLRVCTEGPILLVYPDGIWYRRVDREAIDRIIQDHLLGNTIVEEYTFLSHPLPAIPLAVSPENTEKTAGKREEVAVNLPENT